MDWRNLRAGAVGRRVWLAGKPRPVTKPAENPKGPTPDGAKATEDGPEGL
jgi:hypothetical protein